VEQGAFNDTTLSAGQGRERQERLQHRRGDSHGGSHSQVAIGVGHSELEAVS
jgi:hypothetical protein